VVIDTNAAGCGWFVDQTPGDDDEFRQMNGQLVAPPATAAASRIDLLSVLMHEFGHVLGLSHDDPHDVMAATLATGVRRTVNTSAWPWDAQFVLASVVSRPLFTSPLPSVFEPLSRESLDAAWASREDFPAVRARDDFFTAFEFEPSRPVATKAESRRLAYDDDLSEVADRLYGLLTGVMAGGDPSNYTQDGLLDEDVLEVLVDAQAPSRR
jgi:hypothetical protein